MNEELNKTIDTKTLLFTQALRMFASNGYENVSVRTIADSVGIKTASIYYHYKNKEDILDTCYQYYTNYRYINRLTPEQYQPIVRTGTKKEFLNVINYLFPESIRENMINALIIIHSRIFCDEVAQQIYTDEIDSSVNYLMDFFNYGIEVGRLEPFNVPEVSLIYMSSKLFSAQAATIKTKDENRWFITAHHVFDELLKLIPFKY